MNFQGEAQPGQDLVLDDFVDLDHIFEDYLTRNFTEDAFAAARPAAAGPPQSAPVSTPPIPTPTALPSLPQLPVTTQSQQPRPPFLSYPTDLASLHYGFNALPATNSTSMHAAPAAAPSPRMAPITTVGAPAVPAAASEANSVPTAKPTKAARGGAGGRRGATAKAAAMQEDSDGSSGAESNSSDEPKSRKKTNTSSDGGDKSIAERRHQALQEKNRRAQRRFRERQKAKIQDLHKQIEELTSRVGNLQHENTTLSSRTSILEKVLEMRNEQIQVMQETKEDGSEVGEPEVVSGQALAVGGAGPLESLSPELLRRLTPEEMTGIYQKYVGELGHRLMEMNQGNSPEQKHSVEALVKAVLLLLMRFSIVKPLETRKFVAGSRLSIPSEADALVLWRGAMTKLELSDQQKREMVALKREFLGAMEGVMEQRRQLNVQIQAHFPHASFHTKIALAYIKAHEAVAKLKENLRSEHRLVLEFSAALFKKILTPIQMATLLVHAFPAVPDSLAISSAVAAEMGEDVMPSNLLTDTPVLSNTALMYQALAPAPPATSDNTSHSSSQHQQLVPSLQLQQQAAAQAQSAQQLLQQVASGEVNLSAPMLQMLQMGGMGPLNAMQQQFLAFQQQLQLQAQQQQQQQAAPLQQMVMSGLGGAGSGIGRGGSVPDDTSSSASGHANSGGGQ